MRSFVFLQHSRVVCAIVCSLTITGSYVSACSSDDSESKATFSNSPQSSAGQSGVDAVPVADNAGESESQPVFQAAYDASVSIRAQAGTDGEADAANPAVSKTSDSSIEGGENSGGTADRGTNDSGGGSEAAGEAGGIMDVAGMGGSVAEDECGPIPTGPPEAATPKAVVLYALVEYHTAEENEFVSIHATLTVPAKPPPYGVIFVWPGTQTFPGGQTVQPVGEGVLQPVLTWGNSCVPGALFGYSTWWISPVYVNEYSSIPELRGCLGGPVIMVDVGDRLDLDMRLDGTVWNQTVVDQNSNKSTEFQIDLRGQRQQRALFEIELKTGARPTEDIIFENIVLTMRNPEPGACVLNNRGTNDYATKSRVSEDGLHCCIDRMVLRAFGVPATTQDP